MKKFTIICSVLLVVLFIGMVCFVAFSEDFSEPKSLVAEGEDPDSPVWDMSMQDITEAMAEMGFIDLSLEEELGVSGFASLGFCYGDVEFYWWNLAALDENTAEFEAYKSLMEEGYIDLYNSGNLVFPKKNGPFAMNILPSFEGDADAVEEAFQSIGKD